MWLLGFLTSVDVFLFLGGLGPMGAALIVSWQLGTTQTWLRRVLRWRVSPWYYAFAVLFPVVLYAATNVVALLFGPDLAQVSEHLWGGRSGRGRSVGRLVGVLLQ